MSGYKPRKEINDERNLKETYNNQVLELKYKKIEEISRKYNLKLTDECDLEDEDEIYIEHDGRNITIMWDEAKLRMVVEDPKYTPVVYDDDDEESSLDSGDWKWIYGDSCPDQF